MSMVKKRRWISGLLALGLALAPFSGVMADRSPTVTRIAGADRYETSLLLSRAGFDAAETVVLASGEDFPDALSGGQLAAAVNGPLLVVPGHRVPDALLVELDRLGAHTVYVLGGERTISEEVVDRLSEVYMVTRLAGADRYETSLKAAEETARRLGVEPKEFVASGKNFPDALAATPMLREEQGMLHLTDGITPSTGIAIGGEASVPGAMMERISGATRYQTAVAIAQRTEHAHKKVVLANGTQFPDALSAGGYAAAHGFSILLTPAERLDADTAWFLKKENVEEVILIGGTKALSTQVEAAVRTLHAPPIASIDNTRRGWPSPSTDSMESMIGKYGGISRLSRDSKDLVLTFDLGYAYKDYADRILDTLKEKKVKAYFFVTSAYLDAQPETARRMLREGHIVGNHTQKHKIGPDLLAAGKEQEYRNDLLALERQFLEVTGQPIAPVWRPPEGVWSERSLAIAQSLGYTQTFLWDLAYYDWDPEEQPSNAKALATLKERTRPGGILLLHAVSRANKDVLADYIDWAHAKGYRFVTIPD